MLIWRRENGTREENESKEEEKNGSMLNVRVCRERSMNAIDADHANITTVSAAVTSHISRNIRY
jgi:hypothetical protein